MPASHTTENTGCEERTARLPEEFAAVDRFVDDWVLGDSNARGMKRQASSMEEIREFYDGMLPVAESALTYLGRFASNELPPDGVCLLKLMLALAEVSTAVEWYGSATVPDSFAFSRFELLRQTPDEAAQS